MADTTRTIKIKIDSKNAVKKVDQLDNKMGGLKTSLSKVAIAVASAFAVRPLIRYADEFKNLQNQLRLVTKGTQNLADVTEELFQVAQKSRTSFSATGELYAKLTRSTSELGISQRELIRITETINKTFAVSGASAQEAENAIRQLGQGLSAGALRGDEFNSVAEQAPGILRAVAKETGKSIGELRAFAAEGKITTDLLVRSLQNYAGVVDNEFAQANVTISQSTTVLENSFIRLVGTLDETTGASNAAAQAIATIGESIDHIERLVASGALSNVFNAQLSFIQEDIDKTTTFINKEFGDLFIELGKSSDTVTGQIGNAFLNIAPNVKAMVKIIAIEIATLVEKTGANMEALKSALNVFDDVSADEAFAKMKERFSVLDELRKQEIARILEKNNLDKQVNQSVIEGAQSDIDSFRTGDSTITEPGEVAETGSLTPFGEIPIATQIEFFDAKQSLLENDLLFWQEYNQGRISLGKITTEELGKHENQIQLAQRATQQTYLSTASIALGSLSQLVGGSSKAGKALKLVQAGVNAFQVYAASETAAALILATPPGPVANPSLIGLANAVRVKGAISAGAIMAGAAATTFSGGGGGGSGISAGAATSTASAAPPAPVVRESNQVQTLDTGALINELRGLGSEPIPASFAARILEAIPEARQITGEG